MYSQYFFKLFARKVTSTCYCKLSGAFPLFFDVFKAFVANQPDSLF